MGYTHYWEQKRPYHPMAWATLVTDVNKILVRKMPLVNGRPLALAGSFGEAGSLPQLDANMIAFNGLAPEDYETFLLEREPEHGGGFCKTGRRPYDIMVCLVLLIAYDYAPQYIEVSSDGTYEDWEPAVTLFTQLYKRLPALPPSLRPQLNQEEVK